MTVADDLILTTKLRSPRLDENRVSRRHLLEVFRENRERSLTLVSAPAGYGKSTLVAEWLEKDERRATWVCLDDSDNDLREFVRYLIAAVEVLFPGECSDTAALLGAADLPAATLLARRLINELDAIEEPFTLVLDDYHEIHQAEIHDFMCELLRHPIDNVRWIITTRRDPPLPLASLRASGRMSEFRFDDLRFSESEAAALMARVCQQTLSEAAVSRLDELTEGWVAGLQLVGLAIRHQADPEGFLLGLKGNIREIQDYLAAEVLSRETPEFRECILKTSLVDRFSAGFCAGVCEECVECQLAGKSMIRRMAETGAFMVALDREGEWYRYHPLFRDLLRRRLENESGSEAIADLHSRASRWFEELGSIANAIDHALAAGDSQRAADIVESHLHSAMNADGWQVVERWLRKIPAEVKQECPGLLLGEACVAIERSQLEELPTLVERMEALIDEETAGPEVLGAFNLLRGELHYWQGDSERARDLFLEARGQIPSSQHWVAGENELHLGLSLQALGRRDEARRGLAEAARISGGSSPVFLSRLMAGQVFVDTLSGDLAAASEGARRLESLGKKHGVAYVELWGAYMELLAQFHWLEGDAVVRGCCGLVEKIYLMHSRQTVDTLAMLALCRSDKGSTGSESAIDRLREFAEESGNPELLNVAGSCEARLALRRGDFESAVRWQRSLRESADFPSMLFWVENPLITECRVLTARGSKADLKMAEAKLRGLRKGFANLQNICQLIEVDVLTSLVLEKQGRSTEAFDVLGRVVALGEPGRWLRPFVGLGEPMQEMLDRFQATDEMADYVQQLQAGFIPDETLHVEPSPAPPAPDQPLIEPLTNRELDVLELIAKRLYDKEIADRLSISPGTVKSHLKHIYQKLEVGNRRAAVDRANAMGIVGKSD